MLKRDRTFWVSLNRALDRVLDLPPGEREGWLATFEQESPGVAAEVRRLLALRDSPAFSQFLAGEVRHAPEEGSES